MTRTPAGQAAAVLRAVAANPIAFAGTSLEKLVAAYLAAVAVGPAGKPAVTVTVRSALEVAWPPDLLRQSPATSLYLAGTQIRNDQQRRGYDPNRPNHTTRTVTVDRRA